MGAAFGDNKKENTSIDQIALETRTRSEADWTCEPVNTEFTFITRTCQYCFTPVVV